ncbi:amino acid ABC transporter permease [Paralcaligenes ureilyticus]|uniref:Amino acid ABC transporter membrane protein 1 (PAAT family) n=1 Tax=Paralcaligenes ureilyticus TaxID=627131 RepID=A0A4R3M1Y9_9BURK|nr:amino acid ABC transporter permease [Paralcaligenes ureilyticus]TCT07012.1 amino acid ABC transporter membrane protein 1 (PAAT family) [Paralcaligenes ureilyticus]
MSFLLPYLGEFAWGIVYTIGLVALGWIGAMILGTVLAIMRVSPIRAARIAAAGYILVFRNIPIPVQMVLFVFGFPLLGIVFSLFSSAVIVLIAYHASFVCETLRSGLNTVAVGELEASRSLGFAPFGTMRYLVLPQAFAAVVQPMGNVLILLVKNTSVAAIIGVAELTFTADKIAIEEVQAFIVLGGAALAYVVICLVLKRLVSLLERKVAFSK